MKFVAKPTANVIAKIVFVFLTGIFTNYADSYMRQASINIKELLISGATAIVITYISGIIIFGIRRIFGKPKVSRSFLGYALFYGFYIAMLLFMIQLFLFVEVWLAGMK